MQSQLVLTTSVLRSSFWKKKTLPTGAACGNIDAFHFGDNISEEYLMKVLNKYCRVLETQSFYHGQDLKGKKWEKHKKRVNAVCEVQVLFSLQCHNQELLTYETSVSHLYLICIFAEVLFKLFVRGFPVSRNL